MGVSKSLCRATIQCRCGQTNIVIDSPNALRLVCYCKDCRGYYNTLNGIATTHNKHNTSPASLDPWGGCDYIHIYPGEMNVIEGKGNLDVGKIRTGSPVKRVYTSCCYTPIFSVGGSNSCLVNATLLDESDRPPVQFRIMGRQALHSDVATNRPSISWSVPLSWFWIMSRRLPNKDQLAQIMPIEFPKDIHVFENFKQG